MWSAENEMTVNQKRPLFNFFGLTLNIITLRLKDQILKRTVSTTCLDLNPKLKWSGQIKKAVDHGENRATLLK